MATDSKEEALIAARDILDEYEKKGILPNDLFILCENDVITMLTKDAMSEEEARKFIGEHTINVSDVEPVEEETA